jgi:hypothetical protein
VLHVDLLWGGRPVRREAHVGHRHGAYVGREVVGVALVEPPIDPHQQGSVSRHLGPLQHRLLPVSGASAARVRLRVGEDQVRRDGREGRLVQRGQVRDLIVPRDDRGLWGARR